MKITLDIDEEIAAKVVKIAEARDTTVAELVAEYLTGIATSEASAWLEHIAKLKESIDRYSRDMGPRTWTREDLYERPYCYYDGQQEFRGILYHTKRNP